MKNLRAALLAATTIACLATAGEASAQRYYARERLMVTTGEPTPTPTPTATPTPTPTIYNAYIYDVRKNTRNVNGCAFSSDGFKSGFATWQTALEWCKTIKVAQPNYMSCMIQTMGDGTKQASVSSSACAPTWTGGNWATGDDGHYLMQKIPAAYAGG